MVIGCFLQFVLVSSFANIFFGFFFVVTSKFGRCDVFGMNVGFDASYFGDETEFFELFGGRIDGSAVLANGVCNLSGRSLSFLYEV